MTVDTYKKEIREKNLFYILENRINSRLDKIALISKGGQGESFTYSEVLTRIKQIASGLQKHALLQKKEIGLLSENRPEWGIAYLAILAAGGTVVPIDANLKPNEINYIIKHSNLDIIFTSSNFEESVKAGGNNLKIFSFEDNSPNRISDLYNEPNLLTEAMAEVAVLIYTSGTTGDPKAVELTHQNIIANLQGIEQRLCIEENDTFLSVLPLHHTFEATCGFLTPFFLGAKIIFARSLKSKEILEDIERNNVSIMIGVPLLFEKMYHSIKKAINKAPLSKRIIFKTLYSLSAAGWKVGKKPGDTLFMSLREKTGLNSIRMFISGGAALPSKIARFFNYIGFTMIQGYGLTETSPVLTAQSPKDLYIGSVGQPLSNVEIKIDNPDSSGVGEIITRGDNITRGYRNNKDKTDELIKDGWLHTGDLGKFKKEQLLITGRAKNLIISAAGKNIYPEEIEEKLYDSDFVLETVVFGKKKEGKQGEDVLAIIVPDLEEVKNHHDIDLQNLDLEKLKEIFKQVLVDLNAQIADYKRITDFTIQLHELEKTSTKKIKRFLYK